MGLGPVSLRQVKLQVVRGGGMHELEVYLETAEILSLSPWHIPSSRKSYQLILDGGVDCLAKPADEPPGSPAECKHEVAAWIVARDLHWTDLVATTVLRDIPSQTTANGVTKASVQVVWPRNDRGPDLKTFEDPDMWRAAVFDGLIAHGDRNNTNYLGVPAAGPGLVSRLKLIDHGIGFGGGETNSPFFGPKKGETIPPGIFQALQHWRAGHIDSLRPYLDKGELDSLTQRADRMLQSGSLIVT